ncbi:Hypothetical predicted protein [Octopus vulgaris]|uniref:Uncharacterized protein n=1 Tax=Octopus vulgaris TaxID=6645 RepID=A0AA36EYW0_OCTVU|nr:Hypothetical predicted protein [Octopus vulgaris]
MLIRPHIKTLNIIENYCGKSDGDEEDEKEKEAGSLCDPGVPEENGSPTPVNDQVVKDRGAKGAETGSPSIAVVLRRNKKLEKLEKQKKKGRTENKNKEEKGGKGKTTKAETPTHHTNSREPHGGSNATQYTSGKKKSGRHRRTYDVPPISVYNVSGDACNFSVNLGKSLRILSDGNASVSIDHNDQLFNEKVGCDSVEIALLFSM